MKHKIYRTAQGRNFKNWVAEKVEIMVNGYPTGKFVLKGRYIDNNKYSPFYHGSKKT